MHHHELLWAVRARERVTGGYGLSRLSSSSGRTFVPRSTGFGRVALYQLYIGTCPGPAGVTLRDFGSISALSRHCRRHAHCAGMVVPVLGTTIPVQWACRRRCRDRADIETRAWEQRVPSCPAAHAQARPGLLFATLSRRELCQPRDVARAPNRMPITNMP